MRKVLKSSGQIMPGFPMIPVFEVHCGELVAVLKQDRPQYSPVFFGKERYMNSRSLETASIFCSVERGEKGLVEWIG